MSWIIREIEPRDNAAVESIIRGCLLEFGGDREGTAWWDPDLGRFSEIYNSEERKYWVAEDGGKMDLAAAATEQSTRCRLPKAAGGRIIGGVGIAPLEGADNSGICELQKMYCLPEARGTGVAGELIKIALEHAAKFYDRCYLETFGNMTAAQRFYEKHGFSRIDKPLGNTGHYGCDVMLIKQLKVYG